MGQDEESDISQVHKIYIDPDVGNDTASCLNLSSWEVPCKTLDFAFNHSKDSTAYILQYFNYTITKEVSFTDLTNLAFIGNGAEVLCNGQGVGLAFINVSSITFDRINIRYCAATRNSTSKNFQSNVYPKPMSMFDVSLYFFLCSNITMFGVTVSDSPNASGVVMYDTGGVNVIVNSVFSNNSVTGLRAGGGGFYVEFTYCWPGSQDCVDNATSEHQSISSSKYNFTNVTFAHNTANNEGLNSDSTFIIGYKSNHQSFGRGGGLCLFVKGKAMNNILTFTECTFKNNRAQWGAGAMLELHDETAGNTVSFNDCIFTDNKCNYTFESGTAGGGMRLGHYSFDNSHVRSFYRNKIEYNDCNFSSNSAMYGGGLSISPAKEVVYKYGKPALIAVSRVRFEGNVAKFGSALHISRYPFSTFGEMLEVILKDTHFINNSGHYSRLLNKPNMPHLPHTEGVGAVYINQVDVMFKGSLLFYNNSETGLAVAGSALDFTDSSMTFELNKGYRGGAIALLGSSYLLINDNTTMTFRSNLAKVNGGAMYIRYVEMDNLKTHFNCFIRHTSPLLQPDQWQANFTYIDNTDQNGQHQNSIHTTTVHPCAWAGGNGYLANISKIFCWTNWKYYTDLSSVVECSEEITSEPGHVDLLANGDFPVVPGLKFFLPINVSDDYGNNLKDVTVFRATSNGTSIGSSSYFWKGHGTLMGLERSEEKLTLMTLGDVVWRTELAVKLLQCPPGLDPYPFNADSNSTECSCPNSLDMYRGILSCDSHSHVVTMNDQNWIGYINGEYLVGLCPPGFCKRANNSRIRLPSNPDELTETVCEENRTGVMCGVCVEGYGPAINSHACVFCGNTSLSANVAKYIAAVYLPLTFLFVVLILFDIRLTTGPANAFILYSQVVTTTFSLNIYGQIPFNRITHNSYSVLEKVFLVAYGIFNLEFIENLLAPFCISSNFNALNVLTLDYGVASFPLIMILLTTLCLKLKESCGSRCLGVSKVIKKLSCYKTRNISQALLPAFASFLLLSYHKFSLTSSYLQSLQPLINKTGDNQHPQRVYFAGNFTSSDSYYIRMYCVPSILVSLFLIIVPIILLGYPLTLLEWCLSKVKFLWKVYPVDKVHFFFDTFHGCYKIKLRFFSGLYFLFRLIINAAYVLSSSWITQFVVQQLACIIMITLVAVFQPYKKKYLNYVDTLIFANLATLNTLSLYLYVTSRNEQDPPVSAFVLQYALALLPLFYIIGFVIYYFFTKENWLTVKLKSLVQLSKGKTHAMQHFVTADSNAGSDSDSRVWLTQSADEEMFARARDSNQYCKGSSPGKSIQVDSNESFGTKQSGTASSSILHIQSSEGTGYGTMSTGISDNTSSST